MGTASDIAYCASEGADSYTAAGTWITYQSKQANNALVDYTKSLGLAGVFTFDTSMDTLSPKYQVHKAISSRLAGPVPTPKPTPAPSPAPSDAFKCVNSQCVASAGGVSKSLCESICGSSF